MARILIRINLRAVSGHQVLSCLKHDPLCSIARWKSLLAGPSPTGAGSTMSGEVRRAEIDIAPALTPNSVTLDGSPPNCAMCRWTQRSASRMSNRAMLPRIRSSPADMKPTSWRHRSWVFMKYCKYSAYRDIKTNRNLVYINKYSETAITWKGSCF